MTHQTEQTLWTEFLKKLELQNAPILYVSNHCTDIRIYDKGSSVVKVRRITVSSSRRRVNALIDEYVILKQLAAADIKQIPVPLKYSNDVHFEALECSKIPALPGKDPTLKHKRELFLPLIATIRFVANLNANGFSHGDIHSANIGINTEGRLSCFDFDQALKASALQCFLRDFFGITVEGCASHSAIIDRLLFNQLNKVTSKARRALGLNQKLKRNLLNNYQDRCEASSNERLRKLAKAWDIAKDSNASNPGVPLAYYSIDIDGIHFPGQRPWPLRWDCIRKNVDFSGQRFLELGCNMGMFSIHARASGAASCHGVDIDPTITVAASLAAEAFGCDATFSNVDFDSPEPWEDALQDHDIVSCLSVLYWVKDKPRLAKFLGGFKQLLFEGHATGEEDCNFVSGMGFKTVRLIGVTERNRPLIHGIK